MHSRTRGWAVGRSYEAHHVLVCMPPPYATAVCQSYIGGATWYLLVCRTTPMTHSSALASTFWLQTRLSWRAAGVLVVRVLLHVFSCYLFVGRVRLRAARSLQLHSVLHIASSVRLRLNGNACRLWCVWLFSYQVSCVCMYPVECTCVRVSTPCVRSCRALSSVLWVLLTTVHATMHNAHLHMRHVICTT